MNVSSFFSFFQRESIILQFLVEVMVALMHLYVEGFLNRRLWFMASLTFYFLKNRARDCGFFSSQVVVVCAAYIHPIPFIIIHLFELRAHEHN